MNCTRCPALCVSRTQIVPPSPAPMGGLLAIGEAPGQAEDQLATGFIGAAGKTLDALLSSHGIPRENYGRANICRCRPPDNRRPTKQEAQACLPHLVDFITATQPRILLLVGGTAVRYFAGTGPLFPAIQQSRQPGRNNIDPEACHPVIRPLTKLPLIVIPMPHTSGMAWNRIAPNGEKWSVIGNHQVALAIASMGAKNKDVQ